MDFLANGDRKFGFGSNILYDDQTDTWRPGTMDVLASYGGDVFKGTGSMADALRASEIESNEGRLKVTGPASLYQYVDDKINGRTTTPKLTEDEWKESSYYRPHLKWYDGMTSESARILSENQDDQDSRNFIIARASTAQSVAGVGVSFAAGIIEPRNALAGLAVTAATSLVAGPVAGFAAGASRFVKPAMLAYGLRGERAAAQAIRMAGAAQKAETALAGTAGVLSSLAAPGMTAHVARAVTEGALGAALTEKGSIDAAHTLQQEYGWDDSIVNFITSVGISAVFQGASSYLDRRRGINRLTKMGLSPNEAKDIYITAMAQVNNGQNVNTKPLRELYAQYGDEGTFNANERNKAVGRAESLVRWLEKERGFEATSPDSVGKFFELGYRPMSLRDVVREIGGIGKEPHAGTQRVSMMLDRAELTNRKYPTMINRKSGATLDEFKRAAKEAGFFKDQKLEDIDDDELLGLLKRDLDGQRVYTNDLQGMIDNAGSEKVKRLQEAIGLREGDSVGEIADKLAEYQKSGKTDIDDLLYEATQLGSDVADPKPFAERVREISDSIDNPDNHQLYADAVRPQQVMDEAAKISDAPGADLTSDQREIAALQKQLDEAKAAGLLDDDDLALLDEADEHDAQLDEMIEVISQAITCMKGGAK